VNLQREAAELSKEQTILKEKLQKPPESREFERLKETLARSERNLGFAQKKYERLEKEFGLPVKEFKESKVKNRSLEAKEDYLQKQLEAARDRVAAETARLAAVRAELDGALARCRDGCCELRLPS